MMFLDLSQLLGVKSFRGQLYLAVEAPYICTPCTFALHQGEGEAEVVWDFFGYGLGFIAPLSMAEEQGQKQNLMPQRSLSTLC